MSALHVGPRPRRSAAPAIALIIGVIALLIGAALLAVAAEYKPTVEKQAWAPPPDPTQRSG